MQTGTPTESREQDRAAQDTRVPVSIITGYLGSGKTTLLNALLRDSRLANALVIINEFGEIGIDHLLVSAPTDNMYLLSNGCLCCAFTGDLVETLADVHGKRVRGEIPAFDRVIVETTGLADPVPIMQTVVGHPELSGSYRLETIATLVDAVHAPAQLEGHDECVKQTAIADCLLISKTDIASPETVAGLRESLARVNPGADVHAVHHGQLDPGLLFGRARERASQGMRWTAVPAQGAATEGRTPARHDDGVESFCCWIERPVTRTGLSLWLHMLASFLGPDLLRVKGILDVDGEPVAIHVVQSIIHEPMTLDAWPGEDRRSRLVFITRGIDRARIEPTFEALAASESLGSANVLMDPAAVEQFARLAQNFLR